MISIRIVVKIPESIYPELISDLSRVQLRDLANALGVPLLALFGPTNPVRTQPVFNSPVHILQPARCPATGGGRLADLTPEEVFRKVRQLVPEVAGVD